MATKPTHMRLIGIEEFKARMGNKGKKPEPRTPQPSERKVSVPKKNAPKKNPAHVNEVVPEKEGQAMMWQGRDTAMLSEALEVEVKKNTAADNKRLASAFEKAVRQEAETLGMDIAKLDPPTVYAKGKLIYRENGLTDFLISLHGGVTVFLEAKTTDEVDGFWPDARLQGHQGQTMTRKSALGSLCFVLIRRRNAIHKGSMRVAGDYLVPWTNTGKMGGFLRDKGVTGWDVLDRWRVPNAWSWAQIMYDPKRLRVWLEQGSEYDWGHPWN